MESTVVIKVKHGDTLRRFTARVIENEELELDIIGLRAKIHGLFNFPSEYYVSLTYIDEDGDTVTLVDDNDLRDLMRQHLNFWRIDVQLIKKEPNFNTGDAEVLRLVGEAISKLSLDLASKVTSSNYMVIDLLNVCAKILNPVSQAPDIEFNSQRGVCVEEVLAKFNNAIKITKTDGIGNPSKGVIGQVQPPNFNLGSTAYPNLSLNSLVSNTLVPLRFGIFHKGVRCDSCETNPIIGVRYKSKVKDDYDLCSLCFFKIGNGPDYLRIEHPTEFLDEPSLLKKLEEMGFESVNLNREILRINCYNLHRSIDVLRALVVWRPIIDKLIEMGLYNSDINITLLKKHNGNVKRAVMEILDEKMP